MAFGVYVHWPYCLSKCPYCDFFKQVKKNVDQDALIDDYLKELDFYFDYTSDKTVSSIFFGGGTPSLLSAYNIQKIIDYVVRRWKTASEIEISLEANPNSRQPCLFSDLKKAGINRLSLGVQALNDKDLRFLGRTHNLQQAYEAIEEVVSLFDNCSMDLIYARPEQSLTAWEDELKKACAFGFKHLSLYQLTIEEGTVFAKKGIKPLQDDLAEEMYLFTENYLKNLGIFKYEVSNYARKGFEAKHNLLYWQGDDYLGIGPSAEGRFCQNGKFWASSYRCQLEELTPQEKAEELLLMGLRLKQGLSKEKFEKISGLNFDDWIDSQTLSLLQTQGFVENSSENLRVSTQGFLLLNQIIEKLCR